MVKSVVVLCQLLLLALLFSTVWGDESAEECSGISYSGHKGINRKTGKTGRIVNFRLMHKYGKCSPFRPPNSTWESLISEMIKADAYRKAYLQRIASNSHPTEINPEGDNNIPLGSGESIDTGNYIIKIALGTPGQSLYTIIDTGSDITWTPCNPCSGCDSKATPPFDSSKSSSYKPLDCDSATCSKIPESERSCAEISNSCTFNLEYGDGSTVDAVMSSDKITLGSDSVPVFNFGCATSQTGLIKSAPGLTGLGRSSLSFLSQTASLYDRTFSYCLPSLDSSKLSGSLVFGKEAVSASALKFTPLLTNHAIPSFYYIGLKGISVGGELLSIPPETFAMDTSTGGGTIIDSGTVISRLVEPAYSTLRDAFRKKLSNTTSVPHSRYSLDTCYEASSGSIVPPPITLHFEGGLDLELAEENILIALDNSVCLAFTEESDTISIFGNVQQQNQRIVYDLPNSRLGIAPERCTA
eukprot:Gb_20734 [translate_table: standard]